MENNKILSSELYHEVKYGRSMFSGDKVCVVGEQKVELQDGRIVEQFLYNILGYATQNGKLFLSLKSNIILD